MNLETVIGLEIHAQLKTQSKIFCGCSTEFGAEPNSQTCPICLGMPGVLPVLNKTVVEFAIKLGLATGATINRRSQFARKNYFYPDLPKGYQTSQYDQPIIEYGSIEIEVNKRSKTIGITRIHMEEDAGKLIHDEREPRSYIDLNRTGTPLVEIVSEPDMRSPEEAVAYLKKIHAILRYLDICDGNMQEGSFRCDANISLRQVGEERLGTRTELKNMNSFKNVQAALDYEIRRQRDILLDGETVLQETRLWNPETNRTESMRGKEDAHDYRYFPCPDLIPLEIDEDWIEGVRSSLPELPEARKKRFVTTLGLSEYDAQILTSAKELAEYFERALSSCTSAKKLANWIISEFLREAKGETGAWLASCRVSPSDLGGLICLIEQGKISGKMAKAVFQTMLETGRGPTDIVKEDNLVLVSDEQELATLVKELVAAHPDQAAEYRGGKTKVLGFFVGSLMRQTKGKANPQMVNDLLAKELSGGDTGRSE